MARNSALHLQYNGAHHAPLHAEEDALHLPVGEDSLPTGPGQVGDGGTLDPNLDQGGNVLAVLDWEGGVLSGDEDLASRRIFHVFVRLELVVKAGGQDCHPAVEALHFSSLSQASRALSWAGVL